MEYNKINIKNIAYIGKNILYNNKKLFITLPPMNCEKGIEKYYEKHQMKLEIDDPLFLTFMKDFEENNKKHCESDAVYKSNIFIEGEKGKKYLVVKIPYRYNKYEVSIRSDRVYLPISTDVENTKVICQVYISNLWNFTTADNKNMSGCLMEAKEIIIL